MRFLFIFLLVTLSACTSQSMIEATSLQITDCDGNVVGDVTERDLVMCAARAPIYPPKAQREKIEGVCTTTFDVGVDGRIFNATATCSPQGVFEEATLEAKNYFRYLPRVEGGIPVVTTGVTRKDYFEL